MLHPSASRNRRAILAFVVAAGVGLPAALSADVKSEEKTQVKLEGMLGKMAGMFGGKAMKEGIVNRVALKGDRKSTFNEYTGEIVDLAEEKIYQIDMRKKTYTVMTFAEWRRRMEEDMKKAEKDMKEARQEAAREEPGAQKEYEVDFDLKDTGAKKTINGFDCRQVLATVTVREKGKTLDEAGGMVMTADTWLAPKVAALDELAAFDRRYAAKLMGPAVQASAAQMAAALAMYPGIAKAMEKYQAENVNMDGTAIQTIVRFEGVASAAQTAQQEKAATQEDQGPAPTSLGGMLGGLGKKMSKKKPAEEGAAPGRATIMTTTHEVLQVTPAASDADVSVPAGFKEKEK